jgi:uncharacterized protein
MKASPVRPGDFIEFFAEIDLLVALSGCPGGDCGTSHGDGRQQDYALLLEPDGPFYFAGEHVSWIPGWQEGAVLSAHQAIVEIAKRVRK